MRYYFILSRSRHGGNCEKNIWHLFNEIKSKYAYFFCGNSVEKIPFAFSENTHPHVVLKFFPSFPRMSFFFFLTFRMLIVWKTVKKEFSEVSLAEKSPMFCGKVMEKHLQKTVTIAETVENLSFFCEKIPGKPFFQDSLISLIMLSISSRREGVALIFLLMASMDAITVVWSRSKILPIFGKDISVMSRIR